MLPSLFSSKSVAQPGIRFKLLVKGAEWMALRIESFIHIPRFKGVLDIGQAGMSQFRIVAQENSFQIGIINPAETLFSVDFLSIAVGVEAIRLEPAGGIQDENLEHRLTKAKPGWTMPFGQGADH